MHVKLSDNKLDTYLHEKMSIHINKADYNY